MRLLRSAAVSCARGVRTQRTIPCVQRRLKYQVLCACTAMEKRRRTRRGRGWEWRNMAGTQVSFPMRSLPEELDGRAHVPRRRRGRIRGTVTALFAHAHAHARIGVACAQTLRPGRALTRSRRVRVRSALACTHTYIGSSLQGRH